MIDARIYERFGVLQYMLVLQELHRQGYEKLRWFSYWSPNGCCLRCFFTTQDNICMRYGDLKDSDDKHVWCTSVDQAYTKITDVTPYVDEFKQEMRGLLDNSKGCDSEYVKWFNAIVEKTKEGYMPSFGGEYWDAPVGMIKVGNMLYPGPPGSETDEGVAGW